MSSVFHFATGWVYMSNVCMSVYAYVCCPKDSVGFHTLTCQQLREEAPDLADPGYWGHTCCNYNGQNLRFLSLLPDAECVHTLYPNISHSWNRSLHGHRQGRGSLRLQPPSTSTLPVMTTSVPTTSIFWTARRRGELTSSTSPDWTGLDLITVRKKSAFLNT